MVRTESGAEVTAVQTLREIRGALRRNEFPESMNSFVCFVHFVIKLFP